MRWPNLPLPCIHNAHHAHSLMVIRYFDIPMERQLGFLPLSFTFSKQLINVKMFSNLKEALLIKQLAPHLIAASLYSGKL
jgi:hypothetical protein